MLSKECRQNEIEFFDTVSLFQDEALFRYSETKDNDEIGTDVVHLANPGNFVFSWFLEILFDILGVVKLQGLFEKYIALVRDRPGFSDKPAPLSLSAWKSHCRNHFDQTGFSRYKVTNYEPAMCYDQKADQKFFEEDLDILNTPNRPSGGTAGKDTENPYKPVTQKAPKPPLQQKENPYQAVKAPAVSLHEKEKEWVKKRLENIQENGYIPVPSDRKTVEKNPYRSYMPVRGVNRVSEKPSEMSDTNPYKKVDNVPNTSGSYVPISSKNDHQKARAHHPYRRGGKANFERGYRATH